MVEVTQRESARAKMQRALDRLGLPLKVVWNPETSNGKHGQIESGFLFIYDDDEREAWCTFQHEVYEYKFKEVTQPYYALLNSLIDGVQKLVYQRKENFLESLPSVDKVIAEEKNAETGLHYLTSKKKASLHKKQQ